MGDAGLTEAEMVVMEHLTEASRLFFRLPEHHPSDCQEWAHEVHHLQQRVMARAAVRWLPDYFTPMVGHGPTSNGDHG